LRALLATLLLSGCSAVLNFDECKLDADCTKNGAMFCTSDHLCVGQLPAERLCTGGIVPDKPAADAVYIAGLFHLTGELGDKDTELANAARLAVEQISQVTSRNIAMVLCDTTNDAAVRSIEVAVSRYKAVAVVGPTTSTELLAVAPIINQDGILLVSPSATSPAVTSLSDGDLIWRTCGSDTLQAPVLASLIPTMTSGHNTIVNVAYVDSSYGDGLKTAFVSEWAARSGSTVASTVKFTESTGGSDAVFTRLAQDNPDYTVFVADTDAGAIMQKLYVSAPAAAVQYLFTDGGKGPSLFGAQPVTSVLDRVRGTAPATPSAADPTFANFKLAYQDRFGSDPTTTAFVANTYDATFAVALAIAATANGTVGSTQLVSAMRRMAAPTGMVVEVKPATDFVKGATALAQGGSINLTGASGPLSWDAAGDITDAPIEVWGVKTNVTPPVFCSLPTGVGPCP